MTSELYTLVSEGKLSFLALRVCPKCNYEGNPRQISIHLRKKHNDVSIPLYCCTHCPGNFRQKHLCVVHIRREHLGYSCKECDEVFFNDGEIGHHVAFVHGNGKTWGENVKAGNIEHMKTRDPEKWQGIVKKFQSGQKQWLESGGREIISERMKKNNPMENPDNVKKMLHSQAKYWTAAKRDEQRFRALGQWSSKDYIQNQALSRHGMTCFTENEMLFLRQLPRHLVEKIRYTGDFKERIQLEEGSYFPDFVVVDQKKLIELGEHLDHHEAQIKQCIKLGWGVLLIRNYEVKKHWNRVVKKLEAFV